ncbi:hypothetical protein HDU86_008489 [Geranomyces michiganensis]|nr:hypothetical protein HDU86_008489 [Geranomyces michiganensis]
MFQTVATLRALAAACTVLLGLFPCAALAQTANDNAPGPTVRAEAVPLQTFLTDISGPVAEWGAKYSVPTWDLGVINAAHQHIRDIRPVASVTKLPGGLRVLAQRRLPWLNPGTAGPTFGIAGQLILDSLNPPAAARLLWTFGGSLALDSQNGRSFSSDSMVGLAISGPDGTMYVIDPHLAPAGPVTVQAWFALQSGVETVSVCSPVSITADSVCDNGDDRPALVLAASLFRAQQAELLAAEFDLETAFLVGSPPPATPGRPAQLSSMPLASTLGQYPPWKLAKPSLRARKAFKRAPVRTRVIKVRFAPYPAFPCNVPEPVNVNWMSLYVFDVGAGDSLMEVSIFVLSRPLADFGQVNEFFFDMMLSFVTQEHVQYRCAGRVRNRLATLTLVEIEGLRACTRVQVYRLLIDAGTSRSLAETITQNFQPSVFGNHSRAWTIDDVVVTHLDRDHYGGMTEVLPLVRPDARLGVNAWWDDASRAAVGADVKLANCFPGTTIMSMYQKFPNRRMVMQGMPEPAPFFDTPPPGRPQPVERTILWPTANALQNVMNSGAFCGTQELQALTPADALWRRQANNPACAIEDNDDVDDNDASFALHARAKQDYCLKEKSDGKNYISVVSLTTVNGASFYLTGDAMAQSFYGMEHRPTTVDLYKAAHHGSAKSGGYWDLRSTTSLNYVVSGKTPLPRGGTPASKLQPAADYIFWILASQAATRTTVKLTIYLTNMVVIPAKKLQMGEGGAGSILLCSKKQFSILLQQGADAALENFFTSTAYGAGACNYDVRVLGNDAPFFKFTSRHSEADQANSPPLTADLPGTLKYEAGAGNCNLTAYEAANVKDAFINQSPGGVTQYVIDPPEDPPALAAPHRSSKVSATPRSIASVSVSTVSLPAFSVSSASGSTPSSYGSTAMTASVATVSSSPSSSAITSVSTMSALPSSATGFHNVSATATASVPTVRSDVSSAPTASTSSLRSLSAVSSHTRVSTLTSRATTTATASSMRSLSASAFFSSLYNMTSTGSSHSRFATRV